jgi:uncharacterized Rmd1/YagE family protein
MSSTSRYNRSRSFEDGGVSDSYQNPRSHCGDDDKGNFTDEGPYFSRQNDKLSRTGRQRKKQTARTKGGEFQSKRSKRRVYFCCIGSEIDMTQLFNHLANLSPTRRTNWNATQYGDAICLSRYSNVVARRSTDDDVLKPASDAAKMTESNYEEVYIFEFGVIVFWGVGQGEEKFVLNSAREFVKHGKVNGTEFESGEDDMAFAVSADEEVSQVIVANDVIILPESTSIMQRLSVSYAIAQSSVVSIFEERIDRKVDEYKFIPETLAKVGKISLSIRRVGMMIGDIFVIRHDLNLHSDILDVPDFFWEEDRFYSDYRIIAKYLEMETRVEVLNTRLDMMKELLDMIQQQMQNEHARKLEWIVIWLIVVEVFLEVLGGGGALMGWWAW